MSPIVFTYSPIGAAIFDNPTSDPLRISSTLWLTLVPTFIRRLYCLRLLNDNYLQY